MKKERIGFAFCGSFCTHKKVLEQYLLLTQEYETVIPIVSESAASTDTRFGSAADFLKTVRNGRGPFGHPLHPRRRADRAQEAAGCAGHRPCTGNTLAKLAGGVTDSTVTLAAKSASAQRPSPLLAIASNDALAGNAENIGRLLARKHYYFVPFGQDDPEGKPCSLVADMNQLRPALEAALQGRQLQPLLLHT